MQSRTTTRRRHLGATMRKLRDRAGMTLEDAGGRVGVSRATVSRYETQAGPVKWPIVDALCREYGATDAERIALVGLAKGAKQQGWWNSFADSIPESMNLLLTLEDEEPARTTSPVSTSLGSSRPATTAPHSSRPMSCASDSRRSTGSSTSA